MILFVTANISVETTCCAPYNYAASDIPKAIENDNTEAASKT